MNFLLLVCSFFFILFLTGLLGWFVVGVACDVGACPSLSSVLICTKEKLGSQTKESGAKAETETAGDRGTEVTEDPGLESFNPIYTGD